MILVHCSAAFKTMHNCKFKKTKNKFILVYAFISYLVYHLFCLVLVGFVVFLQQKFRYSDNRKEHGNHNRQKQWNVNSIPEKEDQFR